MFFILQCQPTIVANDRVCLESRKSVCCLEECEKSRVNQLIWAPPDWLRSLRRNLQHRITWAVLSNLEAPSKDWIVSDSTNKERESFCQEVHRFNFLCKLLMTISMEGNGYGFEKEISQPVQCEDILAMWFINWCTSTCVPCVAGFFTLNTRPPANGEYVLGFRSPCYLCKWFLLPTCCTSVFDLLHVWHRVANVWSQNFQVCRWKWALDYTTSSFVYVCVYEATSSDTRFGICTVRVTM